MTDRPIRVLFLCTGNSARSQMAETLLRQIGKERFEVRSAGTHPREALHPLAVETMRELGIDMTGQFPKSVDTFAKESFDYVITVCDRAHESCALKGGADNIHWSFEDPASVAGAEKQRRAFQDVMLGLERRIRLLISVERPVGSDSKGGPS